MFTMSLFYISKNVDEATCMKLPFRRLPCNSKAFITLYQTGITPGDAEELFGVASKTVQNWYERDKFKNTEAAVIGRVLYVLPAAIERVQREMEKKHE